MAGNAQELLLGAARLGHVPVKGVPPSVEAGVQHAVEAFLADEVALQTNRFLHLVPAPQEHLPAGPDAPERD